MAFINLDTTATQTVTFSPPAGLTRSGVSSRAFAYLSYYTWQRVGSWLRHKHYRAIWKDIRRRYCGSGSWPASEERQLFNPAKVATTRTA